MDKAERTRDNFNQDLSQIERNRSIDDQNNRDEYLASIENKINDIMEKTKYNEPKEIDIHASVGKDHGESQQCNKNKDQSSSIVTYNNINQKTDEIKTSVHSISQINAIHMSQHNNTIMQANKMSGSINVFNANSENSLDENHGLNMSLPNCKSNNASNKMVRTCQRCIYHIFLMAWIFSESLISIIHFVGGC